MIDKEKRERIGQAEQQFLGYAIAINSSGNILELVNSMGLKEYEWIYLKRNKMVNNLTKEQIKEVNDYFKKADEGK